MIGSMSEVDLRRKSLWIDGEPVAARAGRCPDVLAPATGKVLARVDAADPEDVDAAVATARRSHEKGAWRRASAAERARVLLRLAEGIRGATEELASLEARNVGKPIREARGEIEM